ncbi:MULTISPECIES: type II toxin-antitoxin system VapC family toxin [Brevibacterium]|uniref:Type II toxin-antitoxin system VapC family toxin n=1 Tax=Brevibacterium metallidurans TaxID=1482676 RepID=A0ABN0SJ88_9MICO
MKYLLDTNIISDARRKGPSPVTDWLSAQRIRDLAISAITLLEIDVGVRLKERKDPQAGAVLRHWFDHQVRESFAGRVLSIDEAVALRASQLHVPDPMPDMDSLIAATALEHSLTLVTRNTADFERTGATLLNPWDG